MQGNRKQTVLFCLVMLFSLSCNPVTQLSATPDPYQEIMKTAINNARSASAGSENQAEQDVTDLLRDQGGARAAFGDQADAIFQQIDEARALAVNDLVLQVTGQSVPPPQAPGAVALIAMSATTGDSPHIVEHYQIATLGGMVGLLIVTPTLFGDAKRDANGNAVLPKLEGTSSKGPATVHISLQPKLIGSRMEANVEMVASLTEPFPYEERSVGSLSVELCPDAQGTVPLQYSFHSGMALKGGGQQLGGEGQGTAYVSDEGKLTTFDMQFTTSGARQPITGAGDDWGSMNKYIEFNIHLGGSFAKNSNDEKLTYKTNRFSSQVTQKYADDTFKGLLGLNAVVFILAFTVAELQWTNGYCVEVRVPEIVTGTKKVQPNSDTPFTATVRHKFEGTELTVPVIATLADGQVSVDPSGSKVPAPASFTYKAPDKSGQTATVTLETRSRRGIGILTVTFETGNLGYNVDAPWGETHIFGKICSGLGNYFTLKWDTPVGLSGTIDFMPSNENGGTWSLTGSLAGGGVTNSGEGSYTIESTTEGIPAMIVLQGQITQTTVGYGDYTSSISGSSIPLEPDACSQP